MCIRDRSKCVASPNAFLPQGVSVAGTAGHGGDAGEPQNPNRGGGIGCGAVPQLAVAVDAPGPDGPVVSHGIPAAVKASNGSDPGKPRDAHRGTPVGSSGAVPEPAAFAEAPGPNGPVVTHGVRAAGATSDGGDAGKPGDLHRGVRASGSAAPQLAAGAVAPGPDGPIAAHGVRAIAADGDSAYAVRSDGTV